MYTSLLKAKGIPRNGLFGLVYAWMYMRTKTPECGCAEAHSKLVGHVAGHGLVPQIPPLKWKEVHAARCTCYVKVMLAGSTGWVEIHVEGETVLYSSEFSHTVIALVTARMFEVIAACSNLEPPQ
ncbi:hypothetical protein HaLaN_23359, partial [Haematococcus lacustris]